MFPRQSMEAQHPQVRIQAVTGDAELKSQKVAWPRGSPNQRQ